MIGDTCVCELVGPASCPTCRDDWMQRQQMTERRLGLVKKGRE